MDRPLDRRPQGPLATLIPGRTGGENYLQNTCRRYCFPGSGMV